MSKVFLGALAIGSLTIAPAYAAGQKPKGPSAPHGNPHTSTSPTTPPKAHGNPQTTAATSGTTTRLNPIAQKLQGKPLGARIEKMLPSTMTLNTASAGFRNQGQFIAAVHVSRNLGIPFADLRAAMLGLPQPGTTGGTTTPMSLGQAIHKLRPSAHSTTEATRAQTQAKADLSITSTATKKKR